MRTLAFIFLASTVWACAPKATPEECGQACDKVTQLYLGAVDKHSESLKDLGTKGAKMAKDLAALHLEYLRDECVRECNAKATRKQTECLVNATSAEDVERCQ